MQRSDISGPVIPHFVTCSCGSPRDIALFGKIGSSTRAVLRDAKDLPHSSREKPLAKFYYGGQAVIEGVMMRGQRHMAVAVRAPGGDIVVHHESLDSSIYRS